MMAGFGGIGFCCCGGPTPCLDACLGPPTVPEEYQIEVSGIGNGQNCDGCDELNGTFVLSYTASSPIANNCSWLSPTMTVCGLGPVIWEYNIVCSNCGSPEWDIRSECRNVLSVRLINGTIITNPAWPYALPYAGYGEVTLPLLGANNTLCNGWPASITVTPL